ncbi:MAG: EamA family transporter [Caulobacteraceae bacterium]|nr:EamA family transporter [Caulobacteraceae bacterium]
MFALASCSLIWSTTWYAIKHQLGVVPPLISVIYRFGLAAAVLFAWCLVTRKSLRLTPRQHLIVAAQGVFVFSLDYSFVYLAEVHVVSAVVAVIFASLSFVNLILFRLVLKLKAAPLAWAGSAVGIVGVAVLSWGEAARAHMDPETLLGIGFGLAGVLTAAIGNLFAAKTQAEEIPIAPATAWAMFYGTAGLALYAIATGEPFLFTPTVEYVGSLIYLAVFGSVAAFLLYYALARRTGYSFASYISALTPPLAMGISAMFEGARWGWEALAGLVLVVIGQYLLIRAPKV